MRLTIDTVDSTLVQEHDGVRHVMPLYGSEAFELISQQWLKIGWNQKYSYQFTWLGRPIVQLPQDMMRVQEVIWQVKPDWIVETGVAHGGSLVYYASLCRSIGTGRVIGIDIEIREHNRKAIECHPLSPLISLLEGDSNSPAIVGAVKSMVRPGESVFVILDSCHSKAHVLKELEAYHSLVTAGSYIVATDGIMRDLHDVPRGERLWKDDNPAAAAEEFARTHTEFVLEQPPRLFDESYLTDNVTYWPRAWLRRR